LAGAAAIVGSMYEPFNYAAGTQFGANSANNGGLGWNATGTATPNAATANWGATGIPGAHGGSAAAKTAQSPGLTYTATGYLAASGNKLSMDAALANQSNNIGRLLGGQSVNAGSMFFSYLTDKNNDTQRTINLAFMGTAVGTTAPANQAERFAIGQIATATGNTGGNIGVLLNNSNPAGLVNAPTPVPYGLNVTHLIVGRIDWNAAGNETITLWLDPTDVTTQTAAGTPYLITMGELTDITTVRPFVGNNSGTFLASSADFDEIRIGGSWASVTTHRVPEPAGLALLALGGLALVRLRKRG
jgi:hypothetical protein